MDNIIDSGIQLPASAVSHVDLSDPFDRTHKDFVRGYAHKVAVFFKQGRLLEVLLAVASCVQARELGYLGQKWTRDVA